MLNDDVLYDDEFRSMLQDFDKFYAELKKTLKDQELESMPSCEQKSFL